MGAFLLGLGVGVVGGMLLAPKPGHYYRAILGEKASEGVDYLKNKTDDLRGSANDAVEKGRDAMSRGMEKMASGNQQPVATYSR